MRDDRCYVAELYLMPKGFNRIRGRGTRSMTLLNARARARARSSGISHNIAVMQQGKGALSMANSWNIPAWLEKEVRDRDKVRVYCGQPFLATKVSARSSASWEHIINDASIITRENIVHCCRGCNASKGQKSVSEWLQSKYCKEKGITEDSVAPIIRAAIANGQ